MRLVQRYFPALIRRQTNAIRPPMVWLSGRGTTSTGSSLCVSHTPPTPLAPRSLVTLSRPYFEKEKEATPKRRRIIMRKPPVTLTDTARSFFQKLLQKPPRDDVIGILLDYHQSTSGEPRMVYSFRFVSAQDIDENLEESVPLWEDDETAKGKLYVHHNAFLKVLGAKLDVDVEKVTPILYDREGNLMDPNA